MYKIGKSTIICDMYIYINTQQTFPIQIIVGLAHCIAIKTQWSLFRKYHNFIRELSHIL